MPSFTLFEPHPHTPTYATPFGRGGAGNLTTSSRPTNLPTPPSTLAAQNQQAATHSARTNKPYHTGRGGAGNMRSASDERRLFSFDEELERDERKKDAARVPVYHIGRGGSGNAINAARTESLSSGSARRGSNGSSASDGSENRKGVAGLLKGLAGRRAA